MGREGFYIDDHAALYGFIAKACEKTLGEKGLETCATGIINMARERGLRSAKRCRADGKELTLKNCLGYGEIFDIKGWGKVEIASYTPAYQTNTVRCGWDETWKKYGFEKYAKIYCKYIDINLVYGFNPQLHFAVTKVLPEGDGCCNFQWLDCDFEDKTELEAILADRMENIQTRTKDFLYHAGHLLASLQRALYNEYGLLVTDSIIDSSLAEYAKLFSQEKAELIREEARQDFSLV